MLTTDDERRALSMLYSYYAWRLKRERKRRVVYRSNKHWKIHGNYKGRNR